MSKIFYNRDIGRIVYNHFLPYGLLSTALAYSPVKLLKPLQRTNVISQTKKKLSSNEDCGQ